MGHHARLEGCLACLTDTESNVDTIGDALRMRNAVYQDLG